MQEGTPIIIKKVKKHGHGHHGGAWKVAYADFVTAMMAFFMVMWILGMSDTQKEAIAAYFNDPVGYSRKTPTFFDPEIGPSKDAVANGDPAYSQNDGLLEDKAQLDSAQGQIEQAIENDTELSKLAGSGDLEVKQTEEGLVLELIENEASGEVFFELGSSSIRDQARAVFEKLAPILAKTKRLMKIEGHTDSRPYPGTGYDNFDLSSERANQVRRLLMAHGVNKKQILGAEGKADNDPRKPEDPTHFSNRRVTVLLPYKYAKSATLKMPTDIVDEKIEGVFARPPMNPADSIGEPKIQKH